MDRQRDEHAPPPGSHPDHPLETSARTRTHRTMATPSLAPALLPDSPASAAERLPTVQASGPDAAPATSASLTTSVWAPQDAPSPWAAFAAAPPGRGPASAVAPAAPAGAESTSPVRRLVERARSATNGWSPPRRMVGLAVAAAVVGATGGALGAAALAEHGHGDQGGTDHVVFVSHDGGPGHGFDHH